MTSYKGGRPPAQPIPVTRFDHTRAEQAWRLHRACVRMANEDPLLEGDMLFNVWRAEAIKRFYDAFEIGGGADD